MASWRTRQIQRLEHRLYEHLVRNHPGWAAIIKSFFTVSKEAVEPKDQDFASYASAVGIFPTLSAAAYRIANTQASVPICAYDAKTDRRLDDKESRLMSILTWPNPGEGYQYFMTKTALQGAIFGNIFLAADLPLRQCIAEPNRRPPFSLWVLETERTRIVPSKSNAYPVKEFTYTGGAVDAVIPAENVLHVKRPHPNDPLYGLSRLKELIPTLNTLYWLRRWNDATFKSGAVTGGVLHIGKSLGDAEKKALLDDLKNVSGVDNAKKILALFNMGDKTSYTPHESAAKDMEFQMLWTEARREVLSVMGVPEGCLGYSESVNYANMTAQKATMYTDTVMPDTELLIDAVNNSPLAEANGEYLKPEWSRVEALQGDVLAKTTAIVSAVSAGIFKINEARAKLGEEEKVPWGEEDPRPQFPDFGLGLEDGDPPAKKDAPAKDEPSAPTPKDEAKEDEDDAEEQARSNGNGNGHGRDAFMKARELEALRLIAGEAPLAAATRDARGQRWLEVQKRRKEVHQRRWYRKLGSLFSDLEDTVMDVLENAPKVVVDLEPRAQREAEEMAPDISTNALFDDEVTFRAWMEELHDTMIATARGGYSNLMRDVNMKLPFDVDDPRILSFLEATTGTRIKNVLSHTRKQVQQLVAASARDGTTNAALERELRDLFEWQRRTRSATIARTETVSIYERGNRVAMEDAGVEEHEWLSARTADTRDSHAIADGQRVRVGANFRVGEGSGPGPGEIGLAEEDINCECTTIPVVN